MACSRFTPGVAGTSTRAWPRVWAESSRAARTKGTAGGWGSGCCKVSSTSAKAAVADGNTRAWLAKLSWLAALVRNSPKLTASAAMAVCLGTTKFIIATLASPLGPSSGG